MKRFSYIYIFKNTGEKKKFRKFRPRSRLRPRMLEVSIKANKAT